MAASRRAEAYIARRSELEPDRLDPKTPIDGREMGEIDAIYRDGAHYDRLFGRGYVEFWLSQARNRGGPILELGCGTGKLSIPLAQAGFSVAGLDNSPALLRFAASKSGDVKWIASDMRSFDLNERFALIMLPSNNLGHLHTPEDFASCISSVKRHLQPGGAFVIDVFVPNLKLLLRDPAEEYVLDEYDDPAGQGRVRVMAQSRYEATTQIVRTTTIRKIGGQPDVVGSLDLKMYFPRELEALVQCNGLRMAGSLWRSCRRSVRRKVTLPDPRLREPR